MELVRDRTNLNLPELVRQCAETIIAQIHDLQEHLGQVDREIHAWHKANAASRRLATIPGIGPVSASAIVATLADWSVFRSWRDFAAWVGLVPRLSGSGGRTRLGHVSKQGDRYLRRLLYLGAVSVSYRARTKASPLGSWINRLLATKPARVVATALANKLARIAWAVNATGKAFEASKACRSTLSAVG